MAIIGAIAVGLFMVAKRSADPAPGTIPVYFEVKNPRHVGHHNFVHIINGVESLSSERQSLEDEEVFDSAVFLVLISEVSGDELVVPQYKVSEARKGPFMHHVIVDAPHVIVLTSSYPWITVPKSPIPEKFLFLLRSRDEDTGWRYREVAVRDLLAERHPAIVVDDLMQEKLIADHPQSDVLSRLIDAVAPSAGS